VSLLARRSKKRDTVVCGRLDCGATLAYVVLGHARNPEGRGLARLWIPGGWILGERDEVWRLTEHAKKRIKRGQPPAYRRRPGDWTRRQAAEQRPAYEGFGRIWGRYLNELPTWIECPRCGWIQTLDPRTLRIESVTLEGWCTWPVIGGPETQEPPLRG
jgi:hypothetical protein